jgi:hypothetical protein
MALQLLAFSTTALLFIIYINDVPKYINNFSNIVLFVEDKSVSIRDKNYGNLKHKIDLTLPYISNGPRQIS